MKGREKDKYRGYVKLVNRCLFHTIEQYTSDKISYNNTEELAALLKKYDLKFDKWFWEEFVIQCKKIKIFKNLGFTYEKYYFMIDYYTEYIQLNRKTEFNNIPDPITTLDFELLNQKNGIYYLQRVMLYYIETYMVSKRVREFIKIKPFDK